MLKKEKLGMVYIFLEFLSLNEEILGLTSMVIRSNGECGERPETDSMIS